MASLNERQREIIDHLGRGSTNSEIASELHLSLNTVKWYLQQIYQILEVRNRVEAVKKARDSGLIRSGSAAEVESLKPLPTSSTPFFGRSKELEQLKSIVMQKETRLVSICGLGGAGKTRLALKIAHQLQQDFPEGVLYVTLKSADDGGTAWNLICRELQIPLSSATVDPKREVANTLVQQKLLLVLDNVDQIPMLEQDLSWLLDKTRFLKILVTSRMRLNLKAEHYFPINGVGYQNGADSSAYQLFIHTARRQNPNFDPGEQDQHAILQLCHLVEGMPLALELAASWTDILPVDHIIRELKHDLTQLSSQSADLPDDQQNLWAVFSYSWRLLSDADREAAMALFPLKDSFTTEAALELSGGSISTIKRLVQTSLLQLGENGRLVIHSLVRLFFEQQAKSAGLDLEGIKDGVMSYYLGWLSSESQFLRESLSARSVAKIDANFNMILSAWQRAIEQCRWDLLESCVDFVMYFEALGLWADGDALFKRSQEALPEHQVWLRARLDEMRSVMVIRSFNMQQAGGLADRALAVLGEETVAKNGVGVYAHLARSVQTYTFKGYEAYTHMIDDIEPLIQAHFGVFGRFMRLMLEGTHLSAQGKYDESAAIFESILDHSGSEIYPYPILLCMHALPLRQLGDIDQARANFEQALVIGKSVSNNPAILTSTFELAMMDKPDISDRELQEALERTAPLMGGRPQLGRLAFHVGGYYTSFGLFGESGRLLRIAINILRGRIPNAELLSYAPIVSKLLLYRLVVARRRR